MNKWLDRARAQTDGDGVPIAFSANSSLTAQTAQTARTSHSSNADHLALKTLSAHPPPSSDDDEATAEAYAERQAICEIDGGLPRSHAALLALACTVPLASHETLESRDATVIHFADHFDRLRKRREASK